ncbi:TPA: GspH/FimT family pseudopilin [Enterobacter cloacae]|nr:hypothetical protein [Enterobacter cloacae]HCE8678931.1 GspH/FimT family pseudopilin [Enterobacter cloacae]HCE9224558.1 GspH/FimT family pseudopilin [Enterobacter cloacae]
MLEVMLVIVILAAAAAGVIAMQNERLSVSGKLRQRVDMFRQTVDYAADLALLEKHAVALLVTEKGWLLYAPQKSASTGWQWKVIQRDDNVSLQGEWNGPTGPELIPSPQGDTPQIIILPDGQITPFTLLFRNANGEKILHVRCAGFLPLDITQLKVAQ